MGPQFANRWSLVIMANRLLTLVNGVNSICYLIPKTLISIVLFLSSSVNLFGYNNSGLV